MSTHFELKHKDITDKILFAFFKIVYPQLGYGFLEKVYENAMLIALQGLGMSKNKRIRVFRVHPRPKLLRRSL